MTVTQTPPGHLRKSRMPSSASYWLSAPGASPADPRTAAARDAARRRRGGLQRRSIRSGGMRGGEARGFVGRGREEAWNSFCDERRGMEEYLTGTGVRGRGRGMSLGGVGDTIWAIGGYWWR